MGVTARDQGCGKKRTKRGHLLGKEFFVEHLLWQMTCMRRLSGGPHEHASVLLLVYRHCRNGSGVAAAEDVRGKESKLRCGNIRLGKEI